MKNLYKKRANRFNFIYAFIVTFLLLSFTTRTVLAVYSIESIDLSFISMLKVYSIGTFYDFVAVSYYIIPFVIYLLIIPNKIFNSQIHRKVSILIYFAFIYSIVFNGFSEWFFWEEFGKRFNFIAVDYLVYTTEVLKNIWESYPIPLLLSIVLLITGVIFVFYYKKIKLFESIFLDESSFKQRFKTGAFLLLLPILFFNILNQQKLTDSLENKFNVELAKNGLYSLFSAFRNNTLDYDAFYITHDTNKVLTNLHKLLATKDAQFVSDEPQNLTRQFTSATDEKYYNVMLVMIESLSASYMGIYGNTKDLTPSIDDYIKKSLFFNRLYATGTRTVRGMEAVTLSIPPTPGRSIVKRPDNHKLSSVGFVFKEKGYENKFIYGGHGYFDNMNEFYSNNGFDIVDRNSFSEDEITFANVWGVCDENLFDKALKEADNSYKNAKPFFNFVMTTSNHRPYTFPKEYAEQTKLKGRSSGVNYTDYAVDKFLKAASKKPWFEDTLFVFVADHNGGSAGEIDLPLYRYLIPAFIYAPKIINPEINSKLSSQIDLMPTVLALMNWNYKSKFYGNNILSDEFKPRAFIGTYQKLGFYRDDRLTILSPDESAKSMQVQELKRKSVHYKEIELNEKDLKDAVSYYQGASYLHKNRLDRYQESK